MYSLQLVYESGKRYTLPFDELVKGILDEKAINRIKAKVLKEIEKNA